MTDHHVDVTMGPTKITVVWPPALMRLLDALTVLAYAATCVLVVFGLKLAGA